LQTCGSSGRSYTYEETRALCRRFGNALLGEVGLRQGDVIGLLLPNIPEYVIAIHGAIEAGIIVTFANPLYTPGEVTLKSLLESGINLRKDRSKQFTPFPFYKESKLKRKKKGEILLSILKVKILQRNVFYN
jgi:non-ribosomal peptide synthetase component E (peptide arylation enzyme)